VFGGVEQQPFCCRTYGVGVGVEMYLVVLNNSRSVV
jgi:hypothetical protein